MRSFAHRASEHASLARIAQELLRLDRIASELEEEMSASIQAVPPERRESARNLVHYVAIRQHDLRDLQLELAQLGLSSLGRSESCVRRSLLETSLRAHEGLALAGDERARSELGRLREECDNACDWKTATHYLKTHTREILGLRPVDRHVSIMVTAPSAKEADRAWMARMLREGMNILRINCAHEDSPQWDMMVRALADARRDTGSECRVLMDLAGPKIRTGAIAGPRVATWKPVKDEVGRVIAPALTVMRRASTSHEEGAAPALFVTDELFVRAQQGDKLRFRDARGKHRALTIREVRQDHIVASARRRAYVLDRARAELIRGGVKVAGGTLEVGGGGAAIDVKGGDPLLLTGRRVKGRPPRRNGHGDVVRVGIVACTLPAALDQLEVGHRVLFDDGRIETVVEKTRKRGRHYLLRVVRTQKETVKLRAEKGINLPDTALKTAALTEEDIRALAFVAGHADAVSLSFVRRPEDVRQLYEELDRLGRPEIGIVLKIETRKGFENLPRLLLEGMRRPLAVMIARGDLAIEVGFERLAELQDEILWLCEASHVPAIWATQVLDSLARTGVPSRAEVTDAAASVAAECVMLNKGPFVGEAVHVLSDILRRMEKHRFKKRNLFRKLRVSSFDER